MTIPILNINEAANFQKCTLTYGHFDLVHPGHIRYLRKASKEGNKLIVALLPDTSDGQKRNFQFNQKERADGLTSFNFIDGILLLEDSELSLLKAVEIMKPNLLVLGTEYQNHKDKNMEKVLNYLKNLGKKIQFHAGDIQYASTKLLSNPKDELLLENKNKFRAVCKKQKVDLKNLLKCIKSWGETKLLVIGDTILDQYIGCEALGMSAEAPVVVVKELQKRNFLGGAAIVASHVKALGAKCEFLSVLGQDDTSKTIKEKIYNQGITSHFIEDSSRPTTFKKRYLVENQKLFRVSRLSDHLIEEDIETQIIEKLEEITPDINGIIISDFVYGVISEKIIESILKLSEKYKFKIFGDLQCSTQVGLVTKFKNFNLISPNEKEARIALQDKDSGLEAISMKLIEITKSDHLVMKLGPEGFISYQGTSTRKFLRQSFPSLSINPLDVSGAGDALLSVLSTALSSGHDLMHASALGCCMAALAVEKMGNTPISFSELESFIIEILEEN